ncbi:hypothetical protein [Nitrosopumilus sp.]|jgi:hypothetical protein|uniref:hypothetical protein n=1 Tax=Nitrosopumilus sp. TaxID=2024843 RepID=UPI0034A006DF
MSAFDSDSDGSVADYAGEEPIEKRFLNLYPEYDYSIQSSSKEKDVRKKKKMKTMY